MSLAFRLELLESSNTINTETKKSLERVIEIFKNKYSIELVEENGSMMITHLAMAITRIKQGEPVKKISEDVYEEILESEYFEKSKVIYEDLQSVIDVVLPEDEKKYMVVNVCVILETLNN